MAEPTTTYLQYRGEVRAIASAGTSAPTQTVIATVHPEGQPGAIAWIDVQKGALAASHEIAGGVALAADDKQVFVASTDGSVYVAKADGSGKLGTVLDGLESAPGALALAGSKWLAVGVGNEVLIVEAKKGGKILQRLPAPEVVTALAADESGAWLVAGTERGHLAVYECEEKEAFVATEVAQCHEGRVLALTFDPDELRVFSSGTDRRLLQTFVRGALSAQDRGGSGMHDDVAAAMLIGPGERWYTTSPDRTVKQWPIGRGGRPSTLRDGTGRGVGLALVTLNDRPHLVQACDDATIRVFAMDAAGQLSTRAAIVHGAGAWTSQELGRREPKRVERALETIAAWNDGAAIDALAAYAGDAGNSDVSLRVLAASLLGKSGHARAFEKLETLLRTESERVRIAAFDGLVAIHEPGSLIPTTRALATGKSDIGIRAVEHLAGLSKKDEQAHQALVQCVAHNDAETRIAGLEALASLYGKTDATGELTALNVGEADVRRAALERLLDRGLHTEAAVEIALRRGLDDADATVRLTAFLVYALTRPALATALRASDKDLHRLFHDAEHAQSTKKTPKLPTQPKASKKALDEAALAPLLDAASSRTRDTSVRGAAGLAALGEVRALGALLELSRDNDGATRVDACKALAVLDDPRALQRLRTMLRDEDASVRDAAFSAVAALLTDDPLVAADAGLSASHDDVRRRGLDVLVKTLRAQTGKGKKRKPLKLAADAPARALLLRALNDATDAVSGEAFKAVLNLEMDGGGEPAIRFVLASSQIGVRREALTEIMGSIAEPWAWSLLLERFDDPASELRAEAFEFATRRGKGRELDMLRAALLCRYPDLRIAATRTLAKRREEGAVLLLVQALNDTDNTVRQLAVDAIVTSGTRSALDTALQSEYSNVRLRAATALAELGDEKVLAVLITEATTPRPTMEDERELWAAYVRLALAGLAELGNHAAIPAVAPLLEYEEAALRHGAAVVLARCTDARQEATLLDALRHEDAVVQYYAAVALSWLGNDTGISHAQRFVVDERGKRRGWGNHRRKGNLVGPDSTWLGMTTALALSTDVFLSFLDHPDDDIHDRALAVLLLQEMASDRQDPDLLIAAMSAANSRTRLFATEALEAYGDPGEYDDVVVATLNFRGDHVEPGTLSLDDTRDIAAMVTFGTGHVRARWVDLLWYLTHEDDEDGRVGRMMERLRTRFDEALAAARAAVPKAEQGPDSRELAVGAYLGLARAGGQEHVRVTALQRLTALAESKAAPPSWQASAVRAQLVALRDGSATVRAAALAHLDTLGADATEVAAEALASGYSDMGRAGLELLTRDADPKKSRAILEQTLLERDDELSTTALHLLVESHEKDRVKIARSGLEATHANARWAAVNLLDGWQREDDSATKALVAGLESRFENVRFSAARMVAGTAPKKALPVLGEMLRHDAREQRTALNPLAIAADKGGLTDAVVTLLLDRVDDDPAGTANVDSIFRTVGNLRATSAIPRLLPWIAKADTRFSAFNAARQCTGFDQWIGDPEDATGDDSWMDGQAPRDVGALATLMDAVGKLGDTYLLRSLLPQARWARGAEVDPILAGLGRFPDEQTRNAALEAIGWRVRKRDMSPEALQTALEYPDPVTQFVAAEGLALAGLRDGLGVLLTSAEMLTETDQRERAVLALGKLADVRALDLLLRYAEDEESEVYSVATEAIGHLGESTKGDEIFAILDKRVGDDDEDISLAALNGLRWFATTAAWAAIRRAASIDLWETQQRVADLLGEGPNTPESIDVLKSLLTKTDDDDVAGSAVNALRKHLGADSMEVDYLIVQAGFSDLEGDTVERLRAHGEPERLFELLKYAEIDGDENPFAKPIADTLLAMDPAPVDAALGGLESDSTAIQTVAAHVVGRAGEGLGKKGQKALASATTDVREKALEVRVKPNAGNELVDVTRLWARTVWACGRCAAGKDEVLAALARTEGAFVLVRREAIGALATGLAGKDGVAALEAAVADADATIRVSAAAALRSLDAKKAAALVAATLDDAATLDQLVDHGDKKAREALGGAARSVHHQGVVAAHLIALADVTNLATAATDGALDELARIGAIEALGRIVSDEKADKALLGIARDEETDAALRKAAWRSLRRQKRLRARTDA